MDIQVRFGQQALELGVRNIHAAVLGAQLVERSIAEAAFASQLLDRHTGFGLFDEADDLLSCICYFSCPSFSIVTGFLKITLVRLGGGWSNSPSFLHFCL